MITKKVWVYKIDNFYFSVPKELTEEDIKEIEKICFYSREIVLVGFESISFNSTYVFNKYLKVTKVLRKRIPHYIPLIEYTNLNYLQNYLVKSMFLQTFSAKNNNACLI